METTTTARTLATYMARPHIVEALARQSNAYQPVRTKAGAKVHLNGNCGIWAARFLPEREYATIPATALCNKCFGYYGASQS